MSEQEPHFPLPEGRISRDGPWVDPDDDDEDNDETDTPIFVPRDTSTDQTGKFAGLVPATNPGRKRLD